MENDWLWICKMQYKWIQTRYRPTKRELIALGIKAENIFWEYESGTKNDRVQLNRLMEIVKEGDSITSLEVSRLTRSTQKLCEIINEVKSKK